MSITLRARHGLRTQILWAFSWRLVACVAFGVRVLWASQVFLVPQFLRAPYVHSSRNPVSRSHIGVRSAGDAVESIWKEAYALEVDRNQLLTEKLQLLDPNIAAESSQASISPDEDDWEDSYQSLSQLNAELEEQLRSLSGSPSFKAPGGQESVGGAPVQLMVGLPGADYPEMLEISPFHGSDAVFFSVQAKLPLGLKFTKRETGVLNGAYVIDAVLQGGSAKESGEIEVGDILQAVSVVQDGSRGGIEAASTEFLSSIVSATTEASQLMVDVAFINTAGELVDAIKTNAQTKAPVTLVLERNGTTGPLPARQLRGEVVESTPDWKSVF